MLPLTVAGIGTDAIIAHAFYYSNFPLVNPSTSVTFHSRLV